MRANVRSLLARQFILESCYFQNPVWLGWAMVLGSFQSQGVLLLLHIVGQGPTVLAAGAVRIIFFLFFSVSNVLSFGRRLNMTEIL